MLPTPLAPCPNSTSCTGRELLPCISFLSGRALPAVSVPWEVFAFSSQGEDSCGGRRGRVLGQSGGLAPWLLGDGVRRFLGHAGC